MLDNGGNPALGRLALTATIQRRLLIIAVVSGLTAVLCYLVGGFPYSSRAIGVACGLVLLIAIGALQGTSVHDRRFFYSVLAVQGALGLAVILFGPFQKRLFGDGAALLRIVEEGTLYPRWLGITAMLRFFYHTVGLGSVLGVESFIRVVGWGAMVGGFAFAGRCAASPFPFLLVLTLPLSFVFIAGHIEIYSAVTGLLSVALATLDRWSLDRASALKILVIAALLPWLYLGFAPFGAILVGVVCLARPRLGILVGLGAAALFLALTAATWSGGLESFLTSLSSQIDTGHGHLVRRYRQLLPEDASIYFPLGAAFSGLHARDLAFMIFYGAGWCLPLCCLAQTPRLMRILRSSDRRGAAEGGGLFLLITTIFYLHYLFFMVPRQGPTKDLDLFFVSYIVIAYALGRFLEEGSKPAASVTRGAGGSATRGGDTENRGSRGSVLAPSDSKIGVDLSLNRRRDERRGKVSELMSPETIVWSSLTAGAIIVAPLVCR